jgi:CRP/FNR family transcriptional regulator, dissimilatory nitrate respiration regulator
MMLETRHSISEILSRQPLFRLLDGSELSRLAKGTYEYRLGKNEMLFQKGDMPKGMHVVVAGQIKLFLPSSLGAEKVVHMAGPGETFGEEGVFLNNACPLAAQATRDSILLVMEKQALLEALERNCILSTALMSRMCSRLCNLIDNMETCVQRNSVQRVVHYLTQMAPGNADSFELLLDVNKQTIASQLNLAPETFSRVLGRLTRDGFIEVKGRSVKVTNLKTLRDFIN